MEEIKVIQAMIKDSTWKYSKDHVDSRKISKNTEKDWKSKKASSWTYSEERENSLKKILNFYAWHNPVVKVTFSKI